MGARRGLGLLACAALAWLPAGCAGVRPVEFEPVADAGAVKNVHDFRGGALCQACHLRGEPAPALLRGEPMALCLGCHKQSHAGNHPVGVAMKEPAGTARLWKGTVTCVSCHDPHAIRTAKGFKGQVTDTCLECHQKHVKGKAG